MVPRPLGRTGLLVSPIGLGTVKLGRNTDVKYPKPFRIPSEAQATELLETALSLGVTLIDTAPAYGESERRLAPFLKRHRDRVVLCTKAGERYVDGRSAYDFSPAAIEGSCHASLERLGTDRLDILLLHSDGRDLDILKGGAVAALQKLKKEGKVRAIGISAKTQEGVLEAVNGLDVVMAPFSKADASRGTALSIAQESGLGVLAIKGLASGALGEQAPEAIRFILSRRFVHSLVFGTIDMDHLRLAVAAADRG
jgi:aryl-alcohol dehydrogenase-like predicted oxidoreductase